MPILILNRLQRSAIDYRQILAPLAASEIAMLSEHTGFEGEFARVERFDNFKSNPAVEFRAYEIGRTIAIDAVVATSEYDLIRAARLREFFGCPGQKELSALAFRDKVLMKDIASHVVETPRPYKRLGSPRDLYSFLEHVEFPVIIKPVLGAGSIDTAILHDSAEVAAFLSGRVIENFEVEKFVPGNMYIVDGLFDRGKIVVGWVSRYVNDCLSFRQGQQASIVQIPERDPLTLRLRRFASELLSQMPTPETTTFHVEAFHTPDQRLVLCEVASRTGGGAINQLGMFRYGVDITRLWIQAQAGIRTELDAICETPMTECSELYGFVQIPPRAGRVPDVPNHAPFPWVMALTKEPGAERMGTQPKESSDKIATVVVRGDSESEVESRMAEISAWMHEKCFERRSSLTARGRQESDVVIRRAEPSDDLRYWSYMNKIGGDSEFLSFGANEYHRTPDGVRDLISGILASRNQVFYLALGGDEIVGAIMLEASQQPRLMHCAELSVTVSKDRWSAGIGSRLMSESIAFFDASECLRRLMLHVRSDHVTAIRLYERFGFKTEGSVKKALCINGAYYDLLSMTIIKAQESRCEG